MGSICRVGLPNQPKIMGWVDIFDLPKFFNPSNLRALAGRGPKVALFFFLGKECLFKKNLDFYYRLCCYYTILICEFYTIDFML